MNTVNLHREAVVVDTHCDTLKCVSLRVITLGS